MHGLIWREDRHYVAMDNNSEWSSEKGRRKEEWMKAVGNIHSYPPRRKQYPKLQLVRERIAGKEDERGERKYTHAQNGEESILLDQKEIG